MMKVGDLAGWNDERRGLVSRFLDSQSFLGGMDVDICFFLP